MQLKEYKIKCLSLKESKIEICYHSDIGGRETQEDSYAISENCNILLATVCDGMGGTLGGELASSTVVKQLHDVFEISEKISDKFYINNLDEIDAAVYYLKSEDDRRLGAGTTIISVMIKGDKLNWLSVGDSRLYILRQQEIVQITRDHNYREMLIDLLNKGTISQTQYNEESARYSALTSYVGMGGIKIYDMNKKPFALKSGDILLLTTDGLYNLIDIDMLTKMDCIDFPVFMESILKTIEKYDTPQRDNTTFIIIKYTENYKGL